MISSLFGRCLAGTNWRLSGMTQGWRGQAIRPPNPNHNTLIAIGGLAHAFTTHKSGCPALLAFFARDSLLPVKRYFLSRGIGHEFFRHGEIYRSEVARQASRERSPLPVPIGFDEFPVGYSLAGCSPAEPASASPTGIHPPPPQSAGQGFFSERHPPDAPFYAATASSGVGNKREPS